MPDTGSSNATLYLNGLRCSLMVCLGLIPLQTKEPHVNHRVPIGSFHWFLSGG